MEEENPSTTKTVQPLLASSSATANSNRFVMPTMLLLLLLQILFVDEFDRCPAIAMVLVFCVLLYWMSLSGGFLLYVFADAAAFAAEHQTARICFASLLRKYLYDKLCVPVSGIMIAARSWAGR